MSADPRAALAVLTAALERHLEACASKHTDDDPAVITAADALADAFDVYDEALYNAFGEVTPLEIYDGDGIDEFGDDDDDDDDDDEDDDSDDDEDDDDEDYDDEDDDYDEDDLDPDPGDDFDEHLDSDDTLGR